ncbi:hypothetical protein COB55_04900 [Candidatus Wolfebacteria bacterium]|nr:MAG: hypothetical protein COB55_04900 [Candidatus Wolfebacteria bacterium]
MNLAGLQKRLQKKVEKVARIDKRIKATAKEVLKVAAIGTPVDTSKALSNWKVSVGAPDNIERDAFVPGEDGRTAGASLSFVLSLGFAAIKSQKEGQAIFIQNNADYIIDLEGGKSTQNKNFIDAAIKRGLEVAGK